jgi:hypothetical protein
VNWEAGWVGALLGVAEAGGEGSALGARFAAQLLPTEIYAERITLAAGPEKALKLGFSVLNELGGLQAEEGSGAPYPQLKAVVRAGFWNLNSAVLYFDIVKGDSASCEINIQALRRKGSSNSTRHGRQCSA